jgi:hypothetical protein
MKLDVSADSDGRLDAAAERLGAAASLARADSVRTAEVLRHCPPAEAKGRRRLTCGAAVCLAWLEPTTYGFKELPILVQNVGDPPYRAWFVDAG